MTLRTTQADQFRAAHRPGTPLVLYNVWDAGTARAAAAAGAPAIATGSWSVAAAHGYPDGERIPLDLVIANLERIVRTVDVPVTVDLESGYGGSPDDVAATLARALAVGAVGCNLEDSRPADGALRDPAEQAARLAAARGAAVRAGVNAFLNARTDVFLGTTRDTHDDAKVEQALERARAYADAGADGLFVPGLVDPRLIERIAKASPLPVNVMIAEGSPSNRELAALGVARISYGPGPYFRLMQQFEAAAREALART